MLTQIVENLWKQWISQLSQLLQYDQIANIQTINITPSTGLEITYGGVYKLGKIVFVQIRCSLSNNISNDILFSGLPSVHGATSNNNALMLKCNDENMAFIRGTGGQVMGTATAGTVIISGCYLTD